MTRRASRSLRPLPEAGEKGRNRQEASGEANIGAMAAASNVSSTGRTIRALRRVEHLTEANIALATLALTTARALDDGIASDAKRYVVAQLSRAHLLALEALVALPEPRSPDAVHEFLSELMDPSDDDTPEKGRL